MTQFCIHFFLNVLYIIDPDDDNKESQNDALCNGSDGEVMNMTANSTEPLNCTTHFYYDVATHTCRPMCGWNPYLRDSSAIITQVFALLSLGTLLLFFFINILTALTIERDKM